jgi:hypothetical protein
MDRVPCDALQVTYVWDTDLGVSDPTGVVHGKRCKIHSVCMLSSPTHYAKWIVGPMWAGLHVTKFESQDHTY